MRNLKIYESFIMKGGSEEMGQPIKDYGQPFLLSNLKKNQKVTYAGIPTEVIDFSEYLVLLSPINNPGGVIKANQNMFNQRGYIQ